MSQTLETPETPKKMETHVNPKTKLLVKEIVIIATILCGLAWVGSRFIHWGGEYTDNAQIRQHIVPVNGRVPGFVKKVYFDEYQQVKKGDTLVVIEDAEYRLKLAQAEADYQNATIGKSALGTTISTTQNNLSVSDAGIDEAQALLNNAKSDYERYQKLLSKGAATQQQFDGAKSNYEAQKARYEMLVKQKASTSLVKDEQGKRMNQQSAGIAVARAAVELARLNLSYTVVIAPCNGVVGRKTIQEGQLVQAGQPLLSVVNSDEKWVVANYKETLLPLIAKGNVVDIEVDALSGVHLKGEVCALSDATGSQYSLVPQDNSAGNFIKVEQLVPVKICFTPENRPEDLRHLRSGMNVECKVRH